MAGLGPYLANAAVRVPAALKLKEVMQPYMAAGRIVGDIRFLSLSKTRNLIQITDFIAETQAFAATNYEYLPPIQTPSPPK